MHDTAVAIASVAAAAAAAAAIFNVTVVGGRVFATSSSTRVPSTSHIKQQCALCV